MALNRKEEVLEGVNAPLVLLPLPRVVASNAARPLQ